MEPDVLPGCFAPPAPTHTAHDHEARLALAVAKAREAAEVAWWRAALWVATWQE